MKRRTFIKYSVASLVVTGCSSVYSPNQVDTDVQNRNANAISAIKAKGLSYPFSIALISDTHDFYQQLYKVVDKIKSDESSYAFVLHGGDITDQGLQQEFNDYTRVIDTLSLPSVHSIGNHDAITNGVLVYKNTFGNFDYSFEVANIHFIFFNNNTWEFGDKPVDLDWLEAQLIIAYNTIATTGGQIFVINHINYNSPERFTSAEITRYIDLMTSYNVSMSINGHNHGHGIVENNGIKYLTIGSVSYNAFMKLTITGPNQFEFTLEQIDA